MKTDGFQLSPEQSVAYDAIMDAWLRKKKLLTIGGLAGTGKTTVLSKAMRALGGKSAVRRAFCCFTGKAADVLRRKLQANNALYDQDYCGTIHGLMYTPRTDSRGDVLGWVRASSLDYDVIVIDEAPMVSAELWKDLSSYGLPVIAVGDHGQLPPIQGNFNLMDKLDVKLEKIHRQAEGNPIIKLSMMARNGEHIPVGQYGEYVSKTNNREIVDRISSPETATILCGYNYFRTQMNVRVRQLQGIVNPHPQPGEKVICLRNEAKKSGIFNGMTGIITSMDEYDDITWWADIDMDGGSRFAGRVSKDQFGSANTCKIMQQDEDAPVHLFDWAYCMTVHKAQGSEYPRVVVFEQRNQHQDDAMWARWLYTAFTRSQERLLIVGD